jgi:hypothetical protein
MEVVMNKILLAACLSLVATQAGAITRYNSTGMTCDRIHATIVRDGAAIMRWNSKQVANLPLYGRYVRDGLFCSAGEVAETSYIPASDTRSCPVLECKKFEFDDPGDDLIFPGR